MQTLCHLNFGKHASIRAQIRSVPRPDKYLCIEPGRKNYAVRIHHVLIAQIMPQRGKMTLFKGIHGGTVGNPLFRRVQSLCHLNFGKHASIRAQIRSVPRPDKHLCIEPGRKNYALRIHQVFIAQIMPQMGKMTPK